MIVIAKKTMKWRGYGFVLKAGRNEIEGKLPYGLLRSIERHAKHNHIQIVEPYVDPDPPKRAKKAKAEDTQNENPETPANPSAGDSGGEGAGSPAPETDAQETTDQDQLDLFFDGAELGEGDGGSAPAASAVVSVETQVSEQPTQPQKRRRNRRK